MDRTAWLKEMQQQCKEQYDTVWAPLYGEEKAGLYSNVTHLQFLQAFLDLLPAGSRVLDAACGAGRYTPFLLEQGHSVVGIDQSSGMLSCAKAKFPQVRFEQVGLQEITDQEAFDGIICVDAMENVCPEDWPLVLGNFHRALKQHGCLYFTAETLENADENEIRQAYEKAQAAGLPVVYGEFPDEGVYHYHPTNQQVREQVQRTGFKVLKEGNGEIWYYHILARKA